MRLAAKLIGIALGCALAIPASAQQITGAGSTFVYPVLSKWSDAYNKVNGSGWVSSSHSQKASDWVSTAPWTVSNAGTNPCGLSRR